MFLGESARLLESRRFTEWTALLVDYRILVFERVLSIAPDANPADWLQFQRDSDPFSPLLWLSVLQQLSSSDRHSVVVYPSLGTDWYQRRHLNVGQILSRKKVRKVILALDEAQHDLDARSCSNLSPGFLKLKCKWWLESTTMVQVFIDTQHKFEMPPYDSSSSKKVRVTKKFSETSFRLDEMMAYLERQSCDYSTYHVSLNFPLLRSEKEFKCLLCESK